MFVKVAEKGDIAPGGMRGFKVDGVEIVLCNDGGRYYALSRRCGHMNAPLDRGTLVGYIITCPMHCAQFEATTGRALAGPLTHEPAVGAKVPRDLARQLGRLQGLMREIRTCDVKTYGVRIEGNSILVDI